MRLATFNVFSGRRADGRFDGDLFAQAVASLEADVLGLQEVDRQQERSGLADLTTLAAAATGLPHHRFAAALAGTPGGAWRVATGLEPLRSPAYGVALLSRFPLVAVEVIRLPACPVPSPYHWPGTRGLCTVRDEPRVALVARLDSPVGRLQVAVTHLSFLPWWNPVQLLFLRARLTRVDEPLVLLGDLNMRPAAAARLSATRSLAAGPTFPREAPARQIDHVLARGALHGKGAPVATEVSDHCALVADVAADATAETAASGRAGC